MNTISRRMIRGRKLDLECMNARIDNFTHNGFKFCCCYGKCDSSNDEPLDMCEKCKAWTNNFTFDAAEEIIGEFAKRWEE